MPSLTRKLLARPASYFNPQSIPITKAEAPKENDATTVFIELRAGDLSGSTETLTNDSLSGQVVNAFELIVNPRLFVSRGPHRIPKVFSRCD